MGKLVVLLGKSASGKDTLLSKLITESGFRRVLPVTTRPIRPGEVNGVTYNFISNEDFLQQKNEGRFIESREYNTLYNGIPDVWRYATSKDSINLEDGNYVAIVDLAALDALRSEYGDNLLSVYIDVSEKVRRQRCQGRGDFNIDEWERREADDEKKYTADVLAEKIDLIMNNIDASESFSKLVDFLKENNCI